MKWTEYTSCKACITNSSVVGTQHCAELWPGNGRGLDVAGRQKLLHAQIWRDGSLGLGGHGDKVHLAGLFAEQAIWF